MQLISEHAAATPYARRLDPTASPAVAPQQVRPRVLRALRLERLAPQEVGRRRVAVEHQLVEPPAVLAGGYTYIYIHTYIHTYIHICMYIYIIAIYKYNTGFTYSAQKSMKSMQRTLWVVGHRIMYGALSYTFTKSSFRGII
jgi:hypothetical protein